MNRRLFFQALAFIGLVPKLNAGELEIKRTQTFLTKYRDDDGQIYYDVNVYGKWKFIATYLIKHPLNIHKSQILRFEGEQIFDESPSDIEEIKFKSRCISALEKNKHKLKFVTDIPNKIYV